MIIIMIMVNAMQLNELMQIKLHVLLILSMINSVSIAQNTCNSSVLIMEMTDMPPVMMYINE